MTNKNAVLVTTASTALLFSTLAPSLAVASNMREEAWWTTSIPVCHTSSSLGARPTLATDSHISRWMEFRALVKAWKSKRGTTSSVRDMVLLSEYQRIVGMGEPAVPLLIQQLRLEGDDPDLWFWALTSITGENPTAEEDRGNFSRMAQSWIDWAQKQGYAG